MAVSETAHAVFEIKAWDEETVDESHGSKITRTKVAKTFRGDINGESTAELLMAYAQEGSAAYVGFERFVGSVHDRAGSFILKHNAAAVRGEQAGEWTILADSGTEQLLGIQGAGRVDRDASGGHSFVLDYDLA